MSSLGTLAGFVGVIVANNLTSETRQELAASSRAQRVRESALNMVLVVPLVVALILVVLGLFPDQEPALYLTAVVLGLFLAALTLAYLIFGHRPAATASDEAEVPAE